MLNISLTIPRPSIWGGIFVSFPLLLSSFIFAGSETGADFLKIPVGAKMVGMGQAATAISAGTDALNWNPAGLSQTDRIKPIQSGIGLSFSHLSYFSENSIDQFGIVVPNQKFSWGLSALRLSYAEQERRTDQRSKAGHFSPNSTAIGFAFSSQISQIRLGSHVKWISEKLASESAQGMAVDIGFMAKTPISKLTWGSSIRNLGPQMHFVEERYHLPLSISVGGALQALPALSLSMDVVNFPHQNKTSLAIGSELLTSNLVSLRAGYVAKLAESISNTQKHETNRGNFGRISGLSTGIGIQFSQLRFDYAFTPFGELGNNHIITLSSRFSSFKHSETPTTNLPGPTQKRDAVIIDLDPEN